MDVSDIEKINDYFECANSEYKEEITLDEWCGIDEKELDVNALDYYRELVTTTYSVWDSDKKYPKVGLVQDVGYWRKANQIHNWFVNHVQNGVDY